MAEVDFSHAKIVPATSYAGSTSLRNPTYNSGVTLAMTSPHNSSGQEIVSTYNVVELVNQQKELAYLWTGTFNASGTEFYMVYNGAGWRIYNISFNSGDTFIFQIKADLICQ